MPTRYLKESICTSESLAQLSAEAERFWYRICVQCDDFGRMDARLPVLRAHCFTMMQDRASDANLERWLTELQQVGQIRRYVVAGRPYLEVITFTEHNAPRATKSKWPAPPTDADEPADLQASASNCVQPYASANNGSQIPSYSYSESNSKGDAREGASEPEQPSPSLPKTVESASSGRTIAERLKTMNSKVSPALRLPLANALVDVTGKRAIVDSGTTAGDKVFDDAQEQAVVLYGMGIKSETQVLELEPAWAIDWRGKSGGTFKQFVEFASEQMSNRRNGNSAQPQATAVY